MRKEERKLSKDEPVPVHGKVVKHRSEKTLEKLENLPEPVTEVVDEKLYFPLPKPLFYLPLVDSVKDSEGSYLALGGIVLCSTPKLQLSSGMVLLEGLYFPEINNFEGNLDIITPLGTGLFVFMADRYINSQYFDEKVYFCEKNTIDLGYIHPLYKTDTLRSKHILNLMGEVAFSTRAMDSVAFSPFSKDSQSRSLESIVGLEYYNASNQNGKKIVFDTNVLGLGLYSMNYEKFFAGVETDLNAKYIINNSLIGFDADAKIRYTDFPVNVFVPKSLVKFNGKEIDCEYPGRAVFQLGVSLGIPKIGFDLRLYEETLVSYGKESVYHSTQDSGSFRNINFSDKFATGLELVLEADGAKLAAGYSFITDFEYEKILDGNFYFTLKADLFRY